MKKEKVQQLKHGLYRIFWKKSCGGGVSLAAVGSKMNGDRWMAPTNWCSIAESGTQNFDTTWKQVKKAELLAE